MNFISVLTLLVTLSITSTLYAQKPTGASDSCTTPVSSTGLVAQWKFSGNAMDSSGNGHHGTIVGSITPAAGKKGNPNTAMSFPGYGNHITVPYSANFNFTKYSVCAIVKPTVLFTGACQGNAVIVRGPFAPDHWGININDNAYNDCSLADTNKYVFTTYAGTASPSGITQQYTPNVHTNIWYCMVATYDGDTVRMYIDGVLKSKYPAASGVMSAGTDSIGIGIDLFTSSGSQFPFTGIMDEIRVYNRALSVDEICYFCTYSGDEKPVSIAGIEKDYSINVYPNPAHDALTLQVGTGLLNTLKQYTVYNALGQSLISGRFNAETTTINIGNLPTGAYYIRVSSGDNSITRQFTVQ